MVAVADNATPIQEEIDLANFNRTPQTNVIKIRTNDLVNFAVVEALAKKLLAEAEIEPSLYKFNGIKLGRLFDVTVSGDERTAARRTSKVLQLVRFSEEWRGLEVLLPDSSRKANIYFDQDKSRAAIRKEILTKRLANLIKEVKPNEDTRAKRADGIVEINRCPIAKIVLLGPVDFRIEWNLNKIVEMDIDRAAMLSKPESGSPSSAEAVSWG